MTDNEIILRALLIQLKSAIPDKIADPIDKDLIGKLRESIDIIKHQQDVERICTQTTK